MVMEGFEKFQKVLLEESKKIILTDWEDNKEELGKALKNRLFGLTGKKHIDHKPTKKEIFCSEMLIGFIEIKTSLDMMSNIEIYVNSFPYKKRAQISKDIFMRYYIKIIYMKFIF